MDKTKRILLEIEEILEKENVNTIDAIVIGMMIIKAAYVLMSKENPEGKIIEYADGICDKLNKSLKRSVFFPDEKVSK